MVSSWKMHRSWNRAIRSPTHYCLWTELLSIPKLHDSTAVTIANEISQTIDDWELWDRIAGLCFDTAALNTGVKGAECKRMKKKLLHLACRHHISELILAPIFSLHDV